MPNSFVPMLNHLLKWLAFAVLLWPPTAGAKAAQPSAESLVLSTEWRFDAAGSASLQDILAATDWQPLGHFQSLGFGPEVVWVRVRVGAADSSTSWPWVLHARPAYLDRLTLYDPASGLERTEGLAVPPKDDSVPSVGFGFQIPALAQERYVYLRLQTISARVVRVDVLPVNEFVRSNQNQEWFAGVIAVMSALLTLWALVQWVFGRDPLIGAFAIKQGMATVWAFIFPGLARLSLGPLLQEGTLTAAGTVMFPLTLACTIGFYAFLISGYQPHRGLLRACIAVVVIAVLLPALQAFGFGYEIRWALNALVVVGFLLLPITILSAYRSRVAQPIPLHYLALYLMVYGTLNSIPSLINLHLMAGGPFVLVGGVAHVILDSVVMFAILQIRARSIRAERDRTTLELRQIQERAELEKRHREEQARLVAMLAHELKTPLATLRMAMEAGPLERGRMERSISAMTQVIDRCVQTGQLSDQRLQPVPQRFDPVDLTRDCIRSAVDPERIDLNASSVAGLMQSDPQMLSIVLGNLIDNAGKYSAPGSRIGIDLAFKEREGREGWEWSVTNRAGPAGLPESDRVFDKYYRSPNARRQSGSGLGLFLVRGLVELMGGTVRYEAKSGDAVFTVWIPA